MHNNGKLIAVLPAWGKVYVTLKAYSDFVIARGGGCIHVSWGTLALTKDGSQKKVKDMEDVPKMAHHRRDQISGHKGSSGPSI